MFLSKADQMIEEWIQHFIKQVEQDSRGTGLAVWQGQKVN